MASMRVADHIGRVLGNRYRLAAVIGTGASAHVFLAEDVRLGRRVAVKILHPALADDAAFLRRFRAEAHAAAGLNHPHVLAVYDWGEEDDGPFIVTEFLGGGSLRAMLDRGRRLTQSQALLVGLEAARGLDYAHRRGLVHRDIKPANLLFDEDGRLRIADFGLARALAEAAWTEPSGALLGTARYAAPEQVRGIALDGKADVFALAVVLVEAVTGRVPFAADTAVGTVLGRLDRPLDVPEELGPLAPILVRAGQISPDARPDAMAFGAALHTLAPKLPSPEPLPLAGPALFDEAQQALDRDPTQLGTATATTAATASTVAAPGDGRPATSAAPAGPDPTAAIGAEPVPAPPVVDPTVAMPVPPPVAALAAEPLELSKSGRRRRRWPRVALAVVLFLICATAGAFAVVETRTPSHPVPDLSNLHLAAAQTAVKALHFKPHVVHEVSDTVANDVLIGQSPPRGISLKEGRVVTLTVSDGPAPVQVPDLTGMTLGQATTALTNAVLKVGTTTKEYSETVDSGIVIAWSPTGGAHHNDTVNLRVSLGPQPRTVPDVSKMTYDQAAAALTNLGLSPARQDQNDDDTPAGNLIGTNPPAGSSVQRGGTVTILVSKGRPVVPNLNGMTQAQAKAALEAVGLKLGNVFGLSGTVFRSNPDSGSKVKSGTSVDIFIL